MPKRSDPYPVTHNKTRYTFESVESRAEWLAYQKYVREHILVSTGLWLTPPTCPLKPKRLDKKTCDGFVREKITFESFPGVIVTGALYTPADAKGKLPAVLCPHGHWKRGRLQEPVQARCINLARQGYVVLAIDMVGYNDNGPITHGFQGDELWQLSLAGLQLWNCIRSLDVLQSLDTVDPERIGVTGASGGGTQTFMVAAVDDRVKVAAPVCMISAHFQGGCLCENAPLMRVVMNNMEIGAAMAPRPLVLVSATGDWTKNNPVVEYPAIRWAYELMNATDKVAQQQFDLGHNYDEVSREVVYGWFAQWLRGKEAGTKVDELPYKLDDDLRIFGEKRKRPDSLKTPDQFVVWWRDMAAGQLSRIQPKDADGLKPFRETLGTCLRHTLCVEPCTDGRLMAWTSQGKLGRGRKVIARDVMLGLSGRGYWLKGKLWQPVPLKAGSPAVLIVHPKGSEAVSATTIDTLVAKGRTVLAVDPLPMGRRKPTKDRYYYVYNRSNLAIRTQEVMMGLAALAEQWHVGRVDLVGVESAGLSAAMGRALSGAGKLGATIIDADAFDETDPAAWKRKERYNPGMLRVGGLSTACGLIAPAALVIHNTADAFKSDRARGAYRAAGAKAAIVVEAGKLTQKQLVGRLLGDS